MSTDRAKQLRQQGIAAAKAGDKEQARQLLQQSIRLEPNSEPAWLWLASVARDQRERVFCLRRILEINPANEQAIKALRQIGELADTGTLPAAPSAPGVRRLGGSEAPAESAPVPQRITTQEMMSQAAGVPLPRRDAVLEAARQAEEVVRQAAAAPPLNVKWVRKTRNRAGERDIWRLRAYVAGASAVVLALLCTGSFFVVSSTPELARIVFAATLTPTLTPTFTPTPTPGFTPTPSVTPRVAPPATATIPPLFPTANAYSPMATAIYPEVVDAPLRGAIALIDRGDLSAALPTLAAERANTSTRFNAQPYYYEALAQARSGAFAAALRTLSDAEERLSEAPTENFAPLVNAGFAYVLNLQAEAAAASGSDARARTIAAEAQERAEAAILRDPRLAQGHLQLARSLYLQGEFEEAIGALDTGLLQPALQYDTNLIAEKARLYFAEGDYEQADRQAYLVLYTDPSVEIAHQIHVNIALLQDNPGLAVLRSQAYLFYYPGRADAWRLLGDARLGERNYELAIDAYSRALTVEQDEATTLAALRGRAEAYMAQRRYALAEEDFSAAYTLAPSNPLRAERMVAAYRAGNYATALEDATALAGRSDVPAWQVSFIRGQALVAEAEAAGEAPGETPISLLEAARSGADRETLGIIDETIARAQFLNRDYTAASETIAAALERGETAGRYYLRGLILQARGQRDAAARAFEWVVTWSAVYPVPFAADAAERLDALR